MAERVAAAADPMDAKTQRDVSAKRGISLVALTAYASRKAAATTLSMSP